MQNSVRGLIGVVCCILGALAARAEGILEQLPSDATGFVAIRKLAATNEKMERVLAIFQEIAPGPLPGPLSLVKAATGIGPGVDEQGDALLVLLPGDNAPVPPRALLLLPVTDYAEFAESIGGDATGEICRVTIADEEVLMAKRDAYAALTNVEHRSQLEQFLTAKPQTPSELRPLAEWLATTDVSAGLTRAGVERLGEYVNQGLADLESQSRCDDDPDAQRVIYQLRDSILFYKTALGFLGAKVQAGAVGLSIDEASNVRVAKRILFAPEGGALPLHGLTPPAKSPYASVESAPFVAALGGPVAPTFGAAASAAYRQLLQKFPEGTGYEGFEADDWDKLELSLRESLFGIKSLSLVLYPGEKDDGLFSNIYAVATTGDSQAYLDHYLESFKLYNEVMEHADSDLRMNYETAKVEVDGKPAVEAVTDVAAAATDPNVPMVEPLMKAMFGPDGKMRIYAIAADGQTVVVGIAPQERVAKAAAFSLNGPSGLDTRPSVATTKKLLDAKAPFTLLLSPQGIAAWATRAVELFYAPFGMGTPEVPQFPETPPVGLSVNVVDNQFQAEIIWPVETLKEFAAYIGKIREM